MSSPQDAINQLIRLFELIQQGNNGEIQQAEKALTQFENTSGYSMIIIQLLANKEINDSIRLGAATSFKNWVLRDWLPNPEAEPNSQVVIRDDDRNVIKKNILNLMVTTPSRIQAQLSQSLAIISQADFPWKWQDLLPELVKSLQNHANDNDHTVLQGLLETANAIFYHYRVDMQSDRLWKEIEYVLSEFAAPLSMLFASTCTQIQQNQDNTQKLTQIFTTLNIEIQIFYSLNFQEIPEYFETNINQWMSAFAGLLQYHNPNIKAHDDPSCVDIVQTSICECINLYATKYETQFKDFVTQFVKLTWELLQGTNTNKRYDHLITTAIKFLIAIVKKEWYKQLFSNVDALKILSERVIIPQLKLRESDVELFQDDPSEYIKIDIEGSDVDTRRRTSIDFIRALLVCFESEITEILKHYVELLIQQYSADRQNWLAKDCAMYIILALAAKSQTQAKGITQINQFLDVGSFFAQQVLSELKTDNKSELTNLPILKADCLKFIANFRAQLPANSYPQLLQILIFYLQSPNYVIHTYSAHCIERLLSVRDETKGNDGKIIYKQRMDKQILKPASEALLQGLFRCLKLEESLENEYIMRCLMRLCSVGQDIMINQTAMIIQNCTQILSNVSKNPRNPLFNHYLFESIAALIYYLCSSDPNLVSNFENALFGPFQQMLSNETTSEEFSSYVFQTMALMLEQRTNLNNAYEALFTTLLQPALWTNSGNVPALIRLLEAYLYLGTNKGNINNNSQLTQGQQQAIELMKQKASDNNASRFEGVLGIFQKILTTKKTELDAMRLITAIIETVPAQIFGQYLVKILSLIFEKLQRKPSTLFTISSMHFAAAFILKHGFQPFQQAMDSIQNGIFYNLLDKLWIPYMKYINNFNANKVTKKTILVGFCDLLCKSNNYMLNEPNVKLWPAIFANLIAILENKSNTSASLAAIQGDEKHNSNAEAVEDADDLLAQSDKSFQTAYSKLVFAIQPSRDMVASLKNDEDIAQHFVNNFNNVFQQNQGKITQYFNSLSQEQMEIIKSFAQKTNLKIQ